MKTAECEGIETRRRLLPRAVCAARVVSVEPIAGQPQREGRGRHRPLRRQDRGLRRAQLPRRASITAYVPAGAAQRARDRDGHHRGVESDGMLASGAELGINRDADGILELDSQAGRAARRAACPDSIIEIDNKSITHRPDLWGHLGMAREVAAILGKHAARPGEAATCCRTGPRAGRRSRSRTSTCARVTARWSSRTSPSSPRRCGCRTGSTAIGLNPINNIVDVTNYVMAELAQPMHAFDADLLHGRHHLRAAGARRARRFVALNEEEYTLDPREPGDRRRSAARSPRRRHRRPAIPRINDKTTRDRAGERQLPGLQHPQDVLAR